MEFSLDTIISIVTLLVGGGSLGGILVWRYTRRKAAAEAEQAENTATKEVQDVYQQLIADVKADRNEQRTYIEELKSDRQHLRQERDELRDRIDKTDETVRDLQREVARNGRMVEGMRPFICGRIGCEDRKPVIISADGEVKTKKASRKKTDEPKDIEPLDMKDM